MVAQKRTSIIAKLLEEHHKISRWLNLEVETDLDSKKMKDVSQLGLLRTSTITTPKYDYVNIDISMLGHNTLPKIKVIKKKRDF